jgi:hypothetical protein
MKNRDSDLIRKLRSSGMSYRQIGQIARCYPGRYLEKSES